VISPQLFCRIAGVRSSRSSLLALLQYTARRGSSGLHSWPRIDEMPTRHRSALSFAIATRHN
jgi:hypothetical protein